MGKNTEDIQSIQKAFLERSGDISVIPSKSEPKVLEVKVEYGVQTILIVLESSLVVQETTAVFVVIF